MSVPLGALLSLLHGVNRNVWKLLQVMVVELSLLGGWLGAILLYYCWKCALVCWSVAIGLINSIAFTQIPRLVFSRLYTFTPFLDSLDYGLRCQLMLPCFRHNLIMAFFLMQYPLSWWRKHLWRQWRCEIYAVIWLAQQKLIENCSQSWHCFPSVSKLCCVWLVCMRTLGAECCGCQARC